MNKLEVSKYARVKPHFKEAENVLSHENGDIAKELSYDVRILLIL